MPYYYYGNLFVLDLQNREHVRSLPPLERIEYLRYTSDTLPKNVWLEELDWLLEADPSLTEVYSIRARCLEALGRTEDAIETLQATIRIKPPENHLVFDLCDLLTRN